MFNYKMILIIVELVYSKIKKKKFILCYIICLFYRKILTNWPFLFCFIVHLISSVYLFFFFYGLGETVIPITIIIFNKLVYWANWIIYYVLFYYFFLCQFFFLLYLYYAIKKKNYFKLDFNFGNDSIYWIDEYSSKNH